MKRKARILLLAQALVIIMVLAGAGAESDQVGFSVRPILTENQIDSTVAYFYMPTEPGQEQIFQVAIKNRSDEDITVGIEINNAFTNAYGMINYSKQNNESNVHAMDFRKLVTTEDDRLFVAAQTSQMAEFRVRMPNEQYTGEILGGLVFTKLDKENKTDEEQTTAKGMSIRHTFNYSIAVRLTQGDLGELSPEFVIKKAEFGSKAGFPALTVSVENQVPLVVKDLAMSIRLFAQDSSEVLALKDIPVMMSPGAQMDYTTLLETESPLETGTYTVETVLELLGRTWNFEAELHLE